MKVWLLNHYATNQYTARAGRHFWFARELIKRGYDATVFCATTFLDNEDEIDNEGQVLSVKRADEVPFVFVKTTVSKGNGIDRVKNMGLFYKNLFPATKRYARKYGKPNVILASSVHPLTMVAGIQIARKWKIPCICEIRDLWPEAIFQFGKAREKSFLGKILISGEHWIYRKANALIFTKEGDTDYLKERKWTTEQGGNIDLAKCHYINNGVDMVDYEQRIENEKLDDQDLNDAEKFNVTYAGTLRPVNNVGNLLDAAKILKSESGYEDVQFLIYGNGVQFEDLQARVKKEHLDNVKMKGFIDRKYIPFILSRSSLNMLNYSQSQYNWTRGNSSNKLFEYMASGKPVISTVYMGYSIIKRYNCGVELDEDSPEALVKQIMCFHDMKKDKYEEIGRNAKEGAKDFDFKALTEKLIDVINDVVSERM